jgi:hypothetical protein
LKLVKPSTRRQVIIITALCCAKAITLGAQAPERAVRFLDVGSEREQILRVLQLTGDVPLYPWTMRQLSPSEQDRLRPTSATAVALLPREPAIRSLAGLRYEVLPMETALTYNSAFPYGFNDGPVWAGRGVTGSLSGGVAGRLGPLSFQLEPMMFDAQNQGFALRPVGTPSNPYVNEFDATEIDLPQRFGDRSYGRFDPGQSTVRLDLGPLFVDFSSADQWWGPALQEPLILGDNAPGFLHGSVGTSRPLNVLIGRIQTRLVYGRLDQSPYALNQGVDSVRFMSGLVGSFTPRGIPGLELGAARFFHSPWPTGGLSHAPFGRPLEGLLKHSFATAQNQTGEDADNQLASIYARWVLPATGVEVYGEYGREDHNIDLRDLWQEPDHDAGYVIGLQRAWKRASNTRLVVHGELLNTRLSALEQGRPQAPWYIHGTLTQGHTQLGQLLGASGGLGGSEVTAAVDRYTPSGRWTVHWDRTARAQREIANNVEAPRGDDVLQALGVENEIRRGGVAYTAGVQTIWDLNRNFSGDKFNVNLRIGARLIW